MWHRPLWSVAVALVLAASPPAGAPLAQAAASEVGVDFVEPDRFADIGRLSADRERTLAGLRTVFESLGAARLAAGQSLHIDVLNVDLAGSILPSMRSPGVDLRVRRGGAEPAIIVFRWVLSAGGRVIASGEERLSDVDTSYHTERDPESALGFERVMLERWFDAHIGRSAGAADGSP